MGNRIYSIMVEPKGPGNERSTIEYTFGLAFSSPLSAGPWREEQKQAVYRAIARYLGLAPDMDEVQARQRIDAQFHNLERFQFYLDSDYDENVDEHANHFYLCLREECEPNEMVVHMILAT